MGKKGGSSGGQTTNTIQKADPWIGAQPYLLGTEGKPGVFPSAANQFSQSGWTPGMQNAADQYIQNLQSRQPLNQLVYSNADSAMKGYFDPTITKAGTINAQQVNPTTAFSSMGAADPTGSLTRLLSGQADTSALNNYMDSAFGRMTDNFQRSVMPSLRSGARLSGQYGSSRQGVAEGLATDALTDSMGDMAANMYNNAFNTAQQNMYGTANNLSGLALSNAQANANRDLLAQQVNANIALQNNAQAMQLANQRLGNVTQGVNLLGAGLNFDNSAYQNALAAMQAPSQFDWQNMNNYANIISAGAGMGGTSSGSSTSPLYKGSPAAGALGGALGGAGIGQALRLSTPWTAGLTIGGGLLGLL